MPAALHIPKYPPSMLGELKTTLLVYEDEFRLSIPSYDQIPCFVRKKRWKLLLIIHRSVTQLEEKIESLVSLLGAHSGALKQDQHSQPPTQNPTPISLDPTLSETRTSFLDKPPLELGCREVFNQETWRTPKINSGNYVLAGTTLLQPQNQTPPQPRQSRSFTNNVSNGEPPPLTTSYDPLFMLPGEEADRVLIHFRDNFASHYPFIVFPHHLNSHELQERKPWVYKAAILVGSPHQRGRQVSMSKILCMEVAEAMILRGEKNLDMLQSMLIHNSW